MGETKGRSFSLLRLLNSQLNCAQELCCLLPGVFIKRSIYFNGWGGHSLFHVTSLV
jgi:hypothetical protein